MSVKEMRDAFNAVSQPRYVCSKALSRYVTTEVGTQLQELIFVGRGADGVSFEVRSEPYDPNNDPAVIATKVAQALLDKQEPSS